MDNKPISSYVKNVSSLSEDDVTFRELHYKICIANIEAHTETHKKYREEVLHLYPINYEEFVGEEDDEETNNPPPINTMTPFDGDEDDFIDESLYGVVTRPIKLSKEDMNKKIVNVLTKISMPLATTVYDLDSEEVNAYLSLPDDKYTMMIKTLMSTSLVYSYMMFLHDPMIKFFYENNSSLSGRFKTVCMNVLKNLSICNFYNLRETRFGQDKESFREKVRMLIIKTNNPFGRKKYVPSFLDLCVPFWRDVKGINITGSIIPLILDIDSRLSCYAPHYYCNDQGISSEYGGENNFKMLTLFFPTEDERDYVDLCVEDPTLIPGDAPVPSGKISEPMALIRVDGSKLHLVRLVSGTDVDLPVWDEESVERISDKISSWYKNKLGDRLSQCVITTRNERSKGLGYSIHLKPSLPIGLSHDEECKYLYDWLTTYPVEIYNTKKEHINTHHVGFTRGYIEISEENPDPIFHLDPSCVWSIVEHESFGYHYFIGKKSTPLDIILKYYWRGYHPTRQIQASGFDPEEYANEKLIVGYFPPM